MTPLDLIPKSVFAAGVIALSLASAMLLWNNKGLEADLATSKKEVAELRAAIAVSDANYANNSHTLTKNLLEAQNAAKKREAVLLADIKSAKSAHDSLRLSIEAAKSTYSLSRVASDTGTQPNYTGLELLETCSERYTELAAETDIYVSYIKEVRQAWPVLPLVTTLPVNPR